MIIIAKILLTIGFALPLFSNMDSIAIVSQLAALCFLGLCSVVCLGMPKQTVNVFDVTGKVLLTAAGLSFLISLATGFSYGILFSILLFGAVTCAEIIRSRLPMQQVFESYCYATVIMVFIVALAYPDDFLASLKGTTIRGVGLVRFSPFDLHPNLAGFMFAAGGMSLVFRAFHVRGVIWKLFYLAFAAGAVCIVFSASARASLVACAVALAFYVPLFVLKNPARAMRFIPLVVVLGLIALGVIAVYHDAVANYFVTIFDLDSDTRGFDSGGSGRTELWEEGIKLLFSQGVLMLFGNGLRYASPDIIGFSTESSYITILLENGILAGGAIIVTFVVATYRQARIAATSRSAFDVEEAIFALMIYAFAQSVFNRYLLGVGNTLSLFLLFVFASPFKERIVQMRRPAARAVKKAKEPEPTPPEERVPDTSLPPIRWN